MAELFSAAALRDLHARFDIVWGQDGTIPGDLYSKALPHACAIIAAQPRLSMDDLASAPNLKVVIEVSGSFPDTIDYQACLLYTSPSPRDRTRSRMPSSA